MGMFLTVLEQVVILILLVLLGVLLTKIKILNDNVARGMTDLVLTFVTPSVIISSFIREYDKKTLNAILLSFLVAFCLHIGFIVVSRLLFGKTPDDSKRVLRFGMIFSNCGFMSLPLQQALLPENGVLYGASYVAIFNLFVWSYGIITISGDKKYMSPKKLILNPGIIALTIGVIVFLTQIPVPTFAKSTLGHLSALNTPVPMIVIGYHLANSDILKGLRDVRCLLSVFIRLFAMPLAAVGIMYLCGVRGDLLVSMAISSSAPIAAITTMFSAKFGKDTELSVNMVSISTVLSLISMPIVVTIAQMIA